MFPDSDFAQPGASLGPSLVDAFAEFWKGGAGPSHDEIDRKIAAAGLPLTEGSKQRKIIAALSAAKDRQAEALMRGLVDTLRIHSSGPYGNGPLGSTPAGVHLRRIIERAGYPLDENFEFADFSWKSDPVWMDSFEGQRSVQLPFASNDFGVPEKITKQEAAEIREAETKRTPPKDIFLVHGHDEAHLYKVSHWVHGITGITPIILSEQINRGKTLIEKFEDASSDSACAIVLMTPDDEARAKRDATAALVERARQNVIFELGYFYGKLKRENVIVLNFGVELPGDISGLVYIGEDSWKVELGKELAALGYEAKF